jgi:CTP:molybdopterin cytidylyltransferase MocA
LTHFAIALGDQPHLERKTLQQLLDFAATHPEKICQPMRNGRRRHPVILPRGVFVKLREYPANDLKQFLNSAPELLAGCETDDPGLDLDLDWPCDYERTKSLADSR